MTPQSVASVICAEAEAKTLIEVNVFPGHANFQLTVAAIL